MKYAYNCLLWRGAGMTLGEIKQYRDRIGRDIQLFGYTSTSLDQNQALNFAWENETSGHNKVLFKIEWDKDFDHYFLNAGAYDQEQEVLLADGTHLRVDSVEDVLNKDGLKVYTIIILK